MLDYREVVAIKSAMNRPLLSHNTTLLRSALPGLYPAPMRAGLCGMLEMDFGEFRTSSKALG
jgi:hypothetical protein